MKKALIICVAGMSSSLMAKKTTDYFVQAGKEITVDAVSKNEGDKLVKDSDFDIFLISPQTSMYLEAFKKAGESVGKPVVGIPFDAYIPIQTGIEKLANLILENTP